MSRKDLGQRRGFADVPGWEAQVQYVTNGDVACSGPARHDLHFSAPLVGPEDELQGSGVQRPDPHGEDTVREWEVPDSVCKV